MSEAAINRFLERAGYYSARARILMREGQPGMARTALRRADTFLHLYRQARLIVAAARFADFGENSAT